MGVIRSMFGKNGSDKTRHDAGKPPVHFHPQSTPPDDAPAVGSLPTRLRPPKGRYGSGSLWRALPLAAASHRQQ